MNIPVTKSTKCQPGAQAGSNMNTNANPQVSDPAAGGRTQNLVQNPDFGESEPNPEPSFHPFQKNKPTPPPVHSKPQNYRPVVRHSLPDTYKLGKIFHLLLFFFHVSF